MPESLQLIINRLIEELLRSVNMVATTMTIVKEQIQQQNERQKQIINDLKIIKDTLTDDQDGIRIHIAKIINQIETANNFSLEHKKSFWSLRNSIIVLLSNAIVGVIVYFITR